MKIATWNVNSLKARLEHVKRYLQENTPDVLMLQELKGLEFPDAAFKAMGYESVAESQKAYNGVAVLSRHPINVIGNILSGGDADDQARYLEVETGGLRLINIYLPNGNPVFLDDGMIYSEKYAYKLSWMERLKDHLKNLRQGGIGFAVGGDFNVIPEERDCHEPAAWIEDALFRIETRRKFKAILNLGLTDAFRAFNAAPGHYTFWDYQAGAWEKDRGIRIDHFLLSPEYADRIKNCMIDKTPRGWERPSDHTPVIMELMP